MDAFAHRVMIAKRLIELISRNESFFHKNIPNINSLPFTVSIEGEHRQLSGPNLFIALQTMSMREWSDPRFFTLAQVERAGWELKADAESINLQYLTVIGSDGLPLEDPESQIFRVFNGSHIIGIPELQPRKQVNIESIQSILANSNDFRLVDGRLEFKQTLRNQMAGSLLTISLGIAFKSEVEPELSQSWLLDFDKNPIGLFNEIKGALDIAMPLITKINLLESEEAILTKMNVTSQNKSENSKDMSMGWKESWAAKVELMFIEKQAVLSVPHAQKDEAKKLGAVYYQKYKLWFVPKGLDIDLFKKWNPKGQGLGEVATRDVLIESFKDAMADLGLDTSKDIKDDGQWHGVSVDTTSKKNEAGRYILTLDGGINGMAIGTIINKQTGQQHTWKYEGGLLTPEQRAKANAEALAREALARQEALAKQDQAAIHAKEIMALGKSANTHGYVLKKGISDQGLKQVLGEVLLRYPEFKSENGASVIRARDNYLIVPMSDLNGNLRALQAINPDGSVKAFMRGGQKKGTVFVLGADNFNALSKNELSMMAYVEGMATGYSFREISGLPVAVCFDASNLETIVDETSDLLPGFTNIIAADNDQFYVERALGFLGEKLGINPYPVDGNKIDVITNATHTRSVYVGDLVTNNEWQETANGTYRVLIEGEYNRKLTVEVVPTDGRKLKATFENRGLEAAFTALETLTQKDRKALIAVPEFNSLKGRPTDWNDLVKNEGVHAAKSVLSKINHVSFPSIELERNLEKNLEHTRSRTIVNEVSR